MQIVYLALAFGSPELQHAVAPGAQAQRSGEDQSWCGCAARSRAEGVKDGTVGPPAEEGMQHALPVQHGVRHR